MKLDWSALAERLRPLATGRYPAGPVALFRIFGAGVALLDIVSTHNLATLFWGHGPHETVVNWAYGAWALVLILLLAGYKTQFTAIANYLFTFPLVQGMPSHFEYHIDYYIHAWAFYLVIMNSGRALSIDSWLERSRARLAGLPEPDQTVPRWPVTLFMIQFSLDYFDAGWFKLNDWEMWRAGFGLYWPLVVRYGSTGIARGIIDWEHLVVPLGHLAFYWELTFPLWMLFKATRIVSLSFGFLFHAGIVVLLPIRYFGEFMIVLYMIFVPWSWIQHVASSIRARAKPILIEYNPSCSACVRRAFLRESFDPRIHLVETSNHLKALPFESHHQISPLQLPTTIPILERLASKNATPLLIAAIAFLLTTKIVHLGLIPGARRFGAPLAVIAKRVNGFVTHKVFMAHHFRKQRVLSVETMNSHGQWQHYPFMTKDGYPGELSLASTRVWVYMLRIGTRPEPARLAQDFVKWLEETEPQACAVRLWLHHVTPPAKYVGDIDVWSKAPRRELLTHEFARPSGFCFASRGAIEPQVPATNRGQVPALGSTN